jgi:hypothetical protein
MPGYRRYIISKTAIWRGALGLTLLALLAGCGSESPVAPTPSPIVQVPDATPTLAEPTPTETVPSPTESPTQVSATTSAGAWASTLRWRGGDWYLLGVNYPYYHYGNDFGANAWGSYGVHDPTTYAAVDKDFAQMSSLGVRTARWFVFADGRAGIKYDTAGLPSGIDEFVTRDLDAALEIAKRHNIGLNLVLLDFRFVWNATTENGVQQGGHASVLATPEGQQALIHNVFEPLFRRYANHPSILSWEVMNEPEWTLQDAGDVDREKISQPLTLATFRSFAQQTVDSIHSVAHSYATIGSADMKWAKNWVGLGLDYYQIHYYDWMKPYSTDNLFAVRADSLQLDRPVIVGEFPADHSTVAGLRDYLDNWYTNGFAGAWAWSFHADTTWGGPDHTILQSWAEAHRTAVDIPATP